MSLNVSRAHSEHNIEKENELFQKFKYVFDIIYILDNIY